MSDAMKNGGGKQAGTKKMAVFKGFSAKTIAFTGIFTALIAVTTMLNIPAPGGGYIHVGDAVIFLACLALPLPCAVLAAGVGSMLSDWLLGYMQYVLPTLIVKAVMAIIVCLLAKNSGKKLKLAAVFLAASAFMQAAYFVYELFLNDFQTPGGILHVLTGLLQTVFSVPLGLLLADYFKVKNYFNIKLK
ncbi:MAG: ECF transporter S component [Clostridiales bacterium]|jgi:uncharacterized membrane protein|nr:ECF transporter S component [Clostridiales bacterium]